MVRTRSKTNIVCENINCPYFHKIQGKNIIKFGKNSAGNQQYHCYNCKVTFSETKGTPLYNRKLSKENILLICKELVERKGLRAVQRTTGIHRDTIGSYLSAFAEHAVKISKYLTKDLGLTTYEMDEFWSFIKKKQKKLIKESSEESNAGDFWSYTSIKRDSYFFSAFTLGKRTTNTCRIFMKQFSETIKTPSKNDKLLIYTEGNFDYKTVIKEQFDTQTVDYGILVKVKEKGKVVNKKKEIVFGSPELKDIETTNVENFNAILRGRLSRLVRKTNTHGKDKNKLNSAVELFKFYWNFIKPLKNNETPAMMENIVEKIWNWEEFLYFKITNVP